MLFDSAQHMNDSIIQNEELRIITDTANARLFIAFAYLRGLITVLLQLVQQFMLDLNKTNILLKQLAKQVERKL